MYEFLLISISLHNFFFVFFLQSYPNRKYAKLLSWSRIVCYLTFDANSPQLTLDRSIHNLKLIQLPNQFYCKQHPGYILLCWMNEGYACIYDNSLSPEPTLVRQPNHILGLLPLHTHMKSWVGAKQHVHSFHGGKGLGIQQRTSVRVGFAQIEVLEVNLGWVEYQVVYDFLQL